MDSDYQHLKRAKAAKNPDRKELDEVVYSVEGECRITGGPAENQQREDGAHICRKRNLANLGPPGTARGTGQRRRGITVGRATKIHKTFMSSGTAVITAKYSRQALRKMTDMGLSAQRFQLGMVESGHTIKAKDRLMAVKTQCHERVVHITTDGVQDSERPRWTREVLDEGVRSSASTIRLGAETTVSASTRTFRNQDGPRSIRSMYPEVLSVVLDLMTPKIDLSYRTI
ncbi:hypothetical protein IW261DRAFT_1591425, partial [Armillaria novae-zelandiae]